MLGSFLNENFVCLRFGIGFQIDISLDENVSVMQPKHHSRAKYNVLLQIYPFIAPWCDVVDFDDVCQLVSKHSVVVVIVIIIFEICFCFLLMYIYLVTCLCFLLMYVYLAILNLIWFSWFSSFMVIGLFSFPSHFIGFVFGTLHDFLVCRFLTTTLHTNDLVFINIWWFSVVNSTRPLIVFLHEGRSWTV